MKSIIYKGFLFASMFAIVGLASCREEQTEEKEVKIKKDADGDKKIKVDTDGN